MGNPRKSKIEPVHLEESSKLKALFDERNKLSQMAFGERFETGAQGMVWQYLNGRSALNVESAIKFARALDCSVSEFSPRLAKLIDGPDDASAATGPPAEPSPVRLSPPELTREEMTLIDGFRLAEPLLRASMLAAADSAIDRLGKRQEEAKKA